MSIGEQLRAAREEKGVTLEQAAEATHVKTDILRALESDDYSAMPAPVYAKGFLKIYAQYLGLDPQAVRGQYNEATAMPAAPQAFHKTAVRLGQSPVDRIISSMATMWGMWALVAAIVVVLALIVSVIVSAIRQPRTASPAPRGAATISKPAPQPPPPTPAPRVPTNVPTVTRDAYIRPVPPPPARLDAPQGESPPEPKAAALPPPLTLSVRLTEDSWIKVVLDGRTELTYRTKRAGWVNEWHAQKSITLTAGNAGGVHVKWNGRDLGAFGRKGQKLEKTFMK